MLPKITAIKVKKKEHLLNLEGKGKAECTKVRWGQASEAMRGGHCRLQGQRGPKIPGRKMCLCICVHMYLCML